MAEKSEIQQQIEEDAQAAQSVSIDGTQVNEHSLSEKIAADKYTRATTGQRRRDCGITFRKIVPHGAVE